MIKILLISLLLISSCEENLEAQTATNDKTLEAWNKLEKDIKKYNEILDSCIKHADSLENSLNKLIKKTKHTYYIIK